VSTKREINVYRGRDLATQATGTAHTLPGRKLLDGHRPDSR